MSQNLIFIFTIAGVCVAFLLFIGLFLSKMYRRASKEVAIVRTGFGGEKIALTGGLLCFPVLHQIIKVKMNTLKLSVERGNKDALITKDRLRVDVIADFYLRVKKTPEAVGDAAQTLGELTHDKEGLKKLMEGKFVDALRAVSAVMTMDELHEKRASFVQQVQESVSDELAKNGLELETVSLVGLDQTAMEHFDENNAFDAEGLKKLTEITEVRKKQRNDIEKENMIAISRRNKDAAKEELSIQQEEQIAKADQEKMIAVERAKRTAETRSEVEAQRQLETEAQIKANEAIETAEIKKNQIIEAATIEKEKVLETSAIAKKRAIELAIQEKEIAIADKSKEQSAAEAAANIEKAKAEEAKEKIITATETEIANRAKNVAVIKANQKAEEDAVSIKVIAEAQKDAAKENAEAVITAARAEADSIRIKAEADEKKFSVDAEGKRLLNEAQNSLSPEVIRMTTQIETIRNAASIIQAAVEPMKSIEGIKIIQLGGLEGIMHGDGSSGSSSGSGNLAEEITNSLLKYRAMSPLVDNLLKETGIDISNAKGLSNIIPKESLGSTIHKKSENNVDLKEE